MAGSPRARFGLAKASGVSGKAISALGKGVGFLSQEFDLGPKDQDFAPGILHCSF